MSRSVVTLVTHSCRPAQARRKHCSQAVFQEGEDWGDGRYLLQIKEGIDFSINRQNADADKILGMVPVQNLNPDMLEQRG